jgi:predicted TIM-barrel fold metal-dependent hydrolase
MNICLAGEDNDRWRENHLKPYRALADKEPDAFGWCTSFSVPDFVESQNHYAERTIGDLQEDFAQGAVACKIWKNIGMELKDPSGRHVMVDDPIFEPILSWIEASKHPMLMHIGEPYACWQPLTPTTPHYGYYSQNRKWHMYGRTDVPDHAAQIASRDHVLGRHPRLNVVGAHLGSLEYDLKELAKRLDQYPNFAVDTSGRLADLAWKNPEEVREFLTKYQDRILWGTDLVIPAPDASVPNDRRKIHDQVQDTWALEYAYYATRETVSVHGRTVKGLGLPPAIQKKIFADNARRWYPGL